MGVKFVAIGQRPSRHAPVPRPGGNGCTGPSQTIPSTAGATAVGAEEPSAGQLSIEGTDPLSHERVADEATRDRSGPSPPVSASQPALATGRAARLPLTRGPAGATASLASVHARDAVIAGAAWVLPMQPGDVVIASARAVRTYAATPAPPRRHPRAYEGRPPPRDRRRPEIRHLRNRPARGADLRERSLLRALLSRGRRSRR